MVFALQVTRSGTLSAGSSQVPGSTQTASLRYLHHDHLGSVAAITDGTTGAVLERLAFDPWGKRRNTNGQADITDSLVGLTTDRGYTEHEHLDEMGLIHMNGRVYDPLVGRMMSADPFIQAPGSLQSYNRYAYVMNNPLNLTDPSGYRWSFKTIVKVVVIAVISYYTAGAVSGAFASASGGASTAFGSWAVTGTGATFQLSAAGGAIAGAAGGFVGGALSTGTAKGGLQGAFTGGVFGGIGATGASNGWGTSEYVAAHAAGGCITSVAGGGSCGSGAASAAFGKYATISIGDSSAISGDLAKGVASSIAGGVGSVIAGGKFENGATTAAFGYLFNYCQSVGCFREIQLKISSFFSNPSASLPKAAGYVGAGGSGTTGPFSASADTGIAFDTRGNICLQTTACVSAGLTADIGGALGVVGQVQQGHLTVGTQATRGVSWMGGKGVAGEGQIQYGDDGLQYGRALVGVGATASGGSGGRVGGVTYTTCQTTTVTCTRGN